jgi:hypothetical protein
MPATPVTVKFTKKQLALIDEAAARAGFKTRSTAVKSFMWHGLNALIAQWRDEDFNTRLAEWKEERQWGGDRKSVKFQAG